MRNRTIFLLLAVIVLLLITFLGFVTQSALASPQMSSGCVRHRHIENWNNRAQVEAEGFFFQIFGDSASYAFGTEDSYRYLSLDLDPTPDPVYAASRISEIDTVDVPVGERVKCWQPTEAENVVAEYTIRFEQPQTPFLTENVFLWNAPFGDSPIPLSAFGVTRSPGAGGAYAGIVAQDVVLNPDFTISGYLVIMPMPAWLDATEWHTVRVTVSQTYAQIEVAQGDYPFTVVLNAPLPHPPEPVGFEFSIDNELFPGFYIPIQVGDRLDVAEYDIQLIR